MTEHKKLQYTLNTEILLLFVLANVFVVKLARSTGACFAHYSDLPTRVPRPDRSLQVLEWGAVLAQYFVGYEYKLDRLQSHVIDHVRLEHGLHVYHVHNLWVNHHLTSLFFVIHGQVDGRFKVVRRDLDCRWHRLAPDQLRELVNCFFWARHLKIRVKLRNNFIVSPDQGHNEIVSRPQAFYYIHFSLILSHSRVSMTPSLILISDRSDGRN